MPRKVKLKEPQYTITELFKEMKRSCELRHLCHGCPFDRKREGRCGLAYAPDVWDLRKVVPGIKKLLTDLPF